MPEISHVVQAGDTDRPALSDDLSGIIGINKRIPRT